MTTTSHPQDPTFAILTPRLILLPTPLTMNVEAYRSLYASLHRTPQFTTMAFGESWGIKDWDAETVKDVIGREVQKSWKTRGMGDFAVGLKNLRILGGEGEEKEGKGWNVVEVKEVQGLEKVQWIGYVGLRDALTTSMLNEPSSRPSTRVWQEMVELRYGFHPDVWSKGYGTEAAKAVMAWCEKEVGVKRFIAETERENKGSGRVLGKLGFIEINEGEEIIWGMEGTKEWERWV